ncbi:MAG: copper chaperone PCu(A)C [Roseibium sp.]|nr:copper chaperone PCu(A)C [Roseibium sp.]
MQQFFKHWMAALVWAATMLVFAFSMAPANAGDNHSAHSKALSGDLSIMAAMSPAPAPGVGSVAVYLTFSNKSDRDVQLVAAESPAFAMGHMHKTVMTDGIMTMEPVAQITVPVGGSVMFEPNGLHIMLMGPKQSFTAGDRFPLTLILDTGKQVDTHVSVVKPGEVMVHDHGSMKMN